MQLNFFPLNYKYFRALVAKKFILNNYNFLCSIYIHPSREYIILEPTINIGPSFDKNLVLVKKD